MSDETLVGYTEEWDGFVVDSYRGRHFFYRTDDESDYNEQDEAAQFAFDNNGAVYACKIRGVIVKAELFVDFHEEAES